MVHVVLGPAVVFASDCTCVRMCVSPCMQERESGGIPFTLSLDHPHKLMVLGQSHDYTQCKATVKSTDKRCSNFANL